MPPMVILCGTIEEKRICNYLKSKSLSAINLRKIDICVNRQVKNRFD